MSFDDRVMEKTFVGARRRPDVHVVHRRNTTFSTADSSEVTLDCAQPIRDTLDGTVTFPRAAARSDHELVRWSPPTSAGWSHEEGNVVFEAGSHQGGFGAVDICGLLAG